MAAPVLDSLHIRKLKPKIFHEFQFSSFLGFAGNEFYGKYQENVRSFVQQCGEIQDYQVANSTIHRIVVRGPEELLFPLYTIEETVEESPMPSCSHCVSCGWGRHFVSKSKYHFIVPKRDRWAMGLDDDFLEHQNHILYGLIHCNGYGHLLCINGVEVDSYSPVEKISEFPCEDAAMNLWDCICSLLHPRAITVSDVMEVKLLHVLAFGKSWYGKWGYQFCNGCYGCTKQKYEKALRVLSTLDIETFEMVLKSKGSMEITRIKQIVDKHRQVSEFSLTKISDLLRFILAFEAEFSMNIDSISSSLAQGKKQSQGKIKLVLVSVANVMKQKKVANVDKLSKQELLQEMRNDYINRKLVDFVVDNVSLFRMNDDVIHCSTTSTTKVRELRIQEISQEVNLKTFPEGVKLAGDLGESLDKDVLDFYSAVSSAYGGSVSLAIEVGGSVSLAIEDVLNSNYFVKQWPEPASSQSTTELCKKVLKSAQEHMDAEEIGKVEQREDDNLYPCNLAEEWSALDLDTLVSYGDDKYNVNCTCGTIYDDGKRMAMCSVCHVIHHTRCSGIEDNADVPEKFLCARCKKQKEEVGMEMNDNVGLKMNDNV